MFRLSLITLFFSFSSMFLLAQGFNGVISGKVVEHTTKNPIPYATIIIEGTTLGAQSDGNGNYKISSLSPGNYRLKVTAIGFQSETKTDIMVNNSKPTDVNFDLLESPIELQGVTVQSNYFSKDAIDVISVRTFSSEEIRRSAGGFEDVIRALSVLPGVAVASAGRNDLVVRGGAPSENLYLLDGMAIPNINHFGSQGSTGGPLSYINLDFVEQTSFSSGGFAVNYGDRLSSVLKIDLREGRKDRIGGKATISASQFGLNLEGPLSDKASFIVSARRSYLDFIFKAAGFGFVPEYYDLLTKFDYKIDNANSISFLYLGAFDNVKWFNDKSDQRYDNSRVLGTDQLQYGTGISFKHLMQNGLLTVSLSRNYSHYDGVQRDTLLNPIFLNNSKEGENKLRVDYIYKIGKTGELNLGGEVVDVSTTYDIKLPSFRTTFGEVLPIDKVNSTDNFLKYNLYFNYSRTYFSSLLINLGVRDDYFSGLETKNYISPRLSGSLKLSPLTAFNFALGIYYQTPSYIWLVANAANKNLEAVKALQYVAGFEHTLTEDTQLKLEGYLKKYDNYPASTLRPYLVLSNTGAGYGGAEDNFSSFGLEPLTSQGTGYAYGVELSAQKKLSDLPFYGIVSLTLNQTKFTAIDGVERSGTYDQNVIFSLSGGYMITKTLEVTGKFRFATGAPYTPYESNGTQLVSKYNSERLKPIHSLDLRLDKKWFYEKLTLITYIDIQNIYGQKNVTVVRFDKRTMAEKKDASIGILPSIGVSLEF